MADFRSHQHTNLTSFSTIDHFIVSERLLINCLDAAPIHLGDNKSNHSPIVLKLKLPEVTQKESIQNIIPQKPRWGKASQDDLNNYTEILHDKLETIPVPGTIHCHDVLCSADQHSHDRDRYLIDVMEQVIETSLECIPVNKPHQSRDKRQILPGWKERVEPYKKDALFWHSVWLSLGRPNTGGVFSVMKHTRNKYHYAVRRLKREVNQMKIIDLLEASEEGNTALFKEMKKSLNSRNSGQEVPDCLEGKVSHTDIVEKFRDCFSELYNACDRSQEMKSLNEKIKQLIRDDSGVSALEVNRINPTVVKQAATRMKPNKTDVTGEYTSDVFLHAPDILFEHLSSIFKSFLTHGTVTKQILACAFLPLYKGGLKNPEKFDSYRAIAGASQLLKLFEYVILEIWGSILTTDSLQFGFKKGVSATQCSWLVMEVANYFVRRGGQVTATFLDLSKAYDKCLFDKLFQNMLDKGFPAVVVRGLIYAYQEQMGWVRLAGKDSSQFPLTNGTRQGSVLSPYLFSACYLDGLLVELRREGLGCYISGVWLGACAYADDIVLLAPNRAVLQRMVTMCEQYGAEFNLQFSTDPNPSKSKTKSVLFCGRNTCEYPLPVKLDGKDLPWVDRVDHLGHILHQSLSMELDASRARASFMTRCSDIRDQFYFARPEQRMRAIQLYCCDAYGTMIWDLKSEYAEQYFRSWNVQSRLAWRVPFNTHTWLLEGYFNQELVTLRNQILGRYTNFVKTLLSSPSKEVIFLSNLIMNDARSVTCSNILYINGLTSNDILKTPAARIRSQLPVLTVPDSELFRVGLLNIFMSTLINKSFTFMNNDRCNAIIESLCNS